MRAIVLAAALTVSIAGPALATSVEALDEGQLAARSDLIARVVVTSARAERVGRRVITFYELDVVDAWRTRDATAPHKTVLALPGGVVEVDGRSIGQLVPGTPVLTVGRAYVLCLGDDVGPQGARGIVGLWQGAFEVLDSGKLRAFVHGHAPIGTVPDVDAVGLRARLEGSR